jgi:cellulose synthase/poly-beta-1,6-N-acetylglucosamine synthase-like glycosyltransferase
MVKMKDIRYILPMNRRPLRIEWRKLFLTHLFVFVAATITFTLLSHAGLSLWLFYNSIATVYLVTALMTKYESLISIKRRYAEDRLGTSARPVPRASFIIPAYLPNEAGIILDTVRHILKRVERPVDGLEVVLVYNTPRDLPVEKKLKGLEKEYSEFRAVRVENSRSKAENLNRAINLINGEIAVIIDADHRPNPDCLKRAWRWLANEYHVVQGRNVIRNSARNWLTRMIAVEFETIYAVSHTGKSLIADTALFGGSNGFWRTDVLRRFLFDRAMLTEDIDITVRILMEGCRIVHDRSLISSEECPDNLTGFWFQRKRWAQGWLQVMLKHQRSIWISHHLNLPQKCYWSYLLLWREIHNLVSHLPFPLMVCFWIANDEIFFPFNWYIILTIIVSLTGAFIQILAAYVRRDKKTPLAWYVWYWVFYLFFATFKNSMALVGLRDEIMGERSWVVTRRTG